MKTLEEILAQVAPAAKVVESLRLASRKNRVWLVTLRNTPFDDHDRIVVKQFQTENFSVEVAALKSALAAGVGVPQILYAVEDCLVLEFLAGPNLCDIFNATLDAVYVQKLADWLAGFHNASYQEAGAVLLKGDARLRNFIFHNGAVFGLDFEEAREDTFLYDVAEAAGSIFDTAPGIENPLFFPVKAKCVRDFLRAYESATTIPFAGEMLHEQFVQFFVQNIQETTRRRGYPETSAESLALQGFLRRLEAGEVSPWNL
jgi:tRNA A-37 threonylcarbamoyl transferase component Bud32